MNDRAIVGLTAAALTGPAAVGFASALMTFEQGPHFLLQLCNWVIISTIVGAPIALLHAIPIGMPAYAILVKRWPIRWWSAALIGLPAGIVPTAIVALMVVAIQAASHEEAIIASLQLALWLLAWLGLAGVTGGLTFWLFARGDAGHVAA